MSACSPRLHTLASRISCMTNILERLRHLRSLNQQRAKQKPTSLWSTMLVQWTTMSLAGWTSMDPLNDSGILLYGKSSTKLLATIYVAPPPCITRHCMHQKMINDKVKQLMLMITNLAYLFNRYNKEGRFHADCVFSVQSE